VFAIVATGHAF